MALESVYGEVSSVSFVKGYYDEINEKYLPMLLSLLPPGPIWEYEEGDDIYELLKALSYAYARIEARGQDLINEMDPRTTFELLSDWERVLDLPGTNPNPAITTQERRDAIHGLLLGFGDPNRSFYEDLAEGLGYNAVVTQEQYSVWVPGSLVGNPLSQHEWRYVWHLITQSGSSDDLLKWTTRLTVPEHTKVFFDILDWTSRDPGFTSDGLLDAARGVEEVLVIVGENAKLSTSPDGTTWIARTSQFTTSDIQTIKYSEDLGLFAIGGVDAKISSSPDGATWTARASNFGTDTILKIHYSTVEALFIAIGTNGKLSTSVNGTAWIARTSQFTASIIRDIKETDGVFVIVGDDQKISSSVDGITWVARTSFFTTGDITAVAYGPIYNNWTALSNLFVAVGSNGQIATSPDGVNWTLKAPDDGGLGTYDSVVYGNDTFVAGGSFNSVSELHYSTDGITWNVAITDLTGDGDVIVTFKFGLFFAAQVGSNDVAVSANGINWSVQTLSTVVNRIEAFDGGFSNIPYNNGNPFGSVGVLAIGPSNALYTARIVSPEAPIGTTWEAKVNPKNFNLLGLALNQTSGLWVACGSSDGIDSYLLTSTDDGETWTEQTNPSTAGLNAVDYNGSDLWCSVGPLAGGDAYIITSPNGTDWTERAGPATGGFTGVAHDQSGLWVAVGNATVGVYTSTDGITWTFRANPSSGSFNAVSYGNGTWVAVGTDVITSTDGITWTLHTNPAAAAFAVAYDSVNDIWVATGTDLITSTDSGATWVQQTHPQASSFINGVVSTGEGNWIAVGRDTGENFAYVLTSKGGIDWFESINPVSEYLNHAAYNPGTGVVLAVGNLGAAGPYTYIAKSVKDHTDA